MFEERKQKPYPLLIILGGILLLIFIGASVWEGLQKSGQNSSEDTINLEAMPKDRKGMSPPEQYFLSREFPIFSWDVRAYTTAMTQAAEQARSRNNYPGFLAPWRVEGPANIGARVNTIAVHPTNPDIIYIGYSTGGAWKTTDGGQNWFPIFDGQTFSSIGDIQLDPLNPEIVYIGTGDPNIGGYSFIGDGLWRSSNGGQTWTNIGLEEVRIISEIRIHPTNPSIIYVAAMGLPFERNEHRGLYKTTDGGQNWSKVLYIGTSTGIIDLVMDPQNSNVLYAASWDRIRNNTESLVAGTNAGIWKTTNGGATWIELEGGLPKGQVMSRIGISINPSNSNNLSAVYVDESLYAKTIYQTADGGQTWFEPLMTNFDYNYVSNFGWYFGKIFYNPYNSNQVWTLGVVSQKSFDGGDTWEYGFYYGDGHVDHHDMAFLSANTALMATDGGLYKTTDVGQSWTKIENIPTTQFYRTAWNPHQPSQYYGGAQDNGTLTGNHSSINAWYEVFGGDGFQAAFHPKNPDIFYYEYQNGNIMGSVDGFSIQDATVGIDPTDRRSWDTPYMISPRNSEVMLTGTHRLYRSESHLPFWFPVSDDLTDGVIFGPRFHVITTIDESALEDHLTFVGTSDGNVWRGNSLNGQFANISAGLPDRYISDVKASPTNPNHVFVSVTGYRYNDFTPHIFASKNRGNTWQNISGDLPNLSINHIEILPGHADSIIFVATDGGVYGTKNGGTHWERLGEGMPIVPVYDLSINEAEHRLFAGTFARSIMSFPLDSILISGDVNVFTPNEQYASSMEVVPSLFDQEVRLNLNNLPAKHQTEVMVTDLSGRLVFTKMYNQNRYFSEKINTSEWPAGLYIVWVRTQGKIWAHQKIVKRR